jgi:hypothetical protein
MFKTVMHIVQVPQGDFCFNDKCTCGYFDNHGGGLRCDLGFYGLEYNEGHFVEKPPECKKMKEFKNE